MHALCAAMDDMVREYLVLLVQLESQFLAGRLTLQKMWFFVQPTLQVWMRCDAMRMSRSCDADR